MVFEGLAAAKDAANNRRGIYDEGQSRSRVSLLYGIEKNYELIKAVVPYLMQRVTVLDQLLRG